MLTIANTIPVAEPVVFILKKCWYCDMAFLPLIIASSKPEETGQRKTTVSMRSAHDIFVQRKVSEQRIE